MISERIGGFNSSVNSSMLNLKSGSIRVLNEHSVDALLVGELESF